MKSKYYLMLLFLILFSQITRSEKTSIPKPVHVYGSVLSADKAITSLTLAVNQPGFKQKEIKLELDSLGNFSTTFNLYYPTDVWIMYQLPILMVVHPGDSINVEIDGKQKDWPSIARTIKFSGDAVKTNEDVATFQYMYYSNDLFLNKRAKENAIKEYNTDQYINYLDTVNRKCMNLYDDFVKKVKPNAESKIWAKSFIEVQNYFEPLVSYPDYHQNANNLNKWDVPTSYYDPLLKMLPLTKSMLISGNALHRFADYCFIKYVKTNLWNEESNKRYVGNDGSIIVPSSEVYDSLLIYGIMKYTPDTLLRQIVLTEILYDNFQKDKIDIYEKNQTYIDTYITESFLSSPLKELYNQTKERIKNPRISTNAILNEQKFGTTTSLLESIIRKNKGKIIYFDCWATWCSPCLNEIPNSKKLMEQMKGKDVAFVFLCIDSQEKIWKSTLDKYQLEGQHYYLNQQQSAEFRSLFNISAIPFYLLLDKEGTSLFPNSNLRPIEAGVKIEEILKKE